MLETGKSGLKRTWGLLSLSLLLTPPTFLGLASLPPPPPSSSYPLNKAAEKGGERYARGGGGHGGGRKGEAHGA